MANNQHSDDIINFGKLKAIKEKSYYIKDSKHRNLLSNLAKKVKKSIIYKLQFQENKNNLVKVWKGIKGIIFIQKAIKIQPKCFKIDNNLMNDSKKKKKNVDEFNTFFGIIAKNIDKKYHTLKSNSTTDQFHSFPT